MSFWGAGNSSDRPSSNLSLHLGGLVESQEWNLFSCLPHLSCSFFRLCKLVSSDPSFGVQMCDSQYLLLPHFLIIRLIPHVNLYELGKAKHTRGNFPILSRILFSRKPKQKPGEMSNITMAEKDGESTCCG